MTGLWKGISGQAASVTPLVRFSVWVLASGIVQAAVFDAVNGIDRRYTSIYVPAAAAPGTSKRAAAMQAAYATLVALYPDQKTRFDQQRAASLAAISDTNDAIQLGVSWGQHVADHTHQSSKCST